METLTPIPKPKASHPVEKQLEMSTVEMTANHHASNGISILFGRIEHNNKT